MKVKDLLPIYSADKPGTKDDTAYDYGVASRFVDWTPHVGVSTKSLMSKLPVGPKIAPNSPDIFDYSREPMTEKKISNLLEIKKTHDQCSDEIDEYHAAARDSLVKLKKELGLLDSEAGKHFKTATENLQKAIALAKSWDRRCG